MSNTREHYERCVRIANALFQGNANPVRVKVFLTLELDESRAKDRIEYTTDIFRDIVAHKISQEDIPAIIDATMHSFTSDIEAITFLESVVGFDDRLTTKEIKFALGLTVFTHFIQVIDAQYRERLIQCYADLLKNGEELNLKNLEGFWRIDVAQVQSRLSKMTLEAASNPRGWRAVEVLGKIKMEKCDLVVADNALAVTIREFSHRAIKTLSPKAIVHMLQKGYPKGG